MYYNNIYIYIYIYITCIYIFHIIILYLDCFFLAGIAISLLEIGGVVGSIATGVITDKWMLKVR